MQVVHEVLQAVHRLLEVFLYCPSGQVERQEFEGELKNNEPLQVRHWVEDPPEQVMQEELQFKQEGDGVVD